MLASLLPSSVRWLSCLAAMAALVVGGCNAESSSGDDPSSAGGSGDGGSGVGGSGGEPPACDMWVERATPPDVLIGPTGLRELLVGKIDAATSSIELMMYQLDCSPCVDALVNAHNRGVAVRVLLDGEQSVNTAATNALQAAGVPLQQGPAAFDHNHAKVLILDQSQAVVMSANMNSYSFASERNYGVVDYDPQDVAQLSAIFDRDWAGSGDVDTSCTRLIVSPLNARQRLLTLIGSATETLDFGVMYISDAEVKHAIKAKMTDGVRVRLLLAMPEWIDSNTATAQELSAAGAETKYLYTHELHAKLVIADGVPFVGSENFSSTSLDQNREVGLLVTESASAAVIAEQFEQDWAQGTAAP